MGTITQIITFINAEKYPNALEREYYYTHITIGDKEKKIRKNYQKKLKKINNEIL